MDLDEYLRVVRNRWVSATVVALITVATVAAGTFLLTPQYTSATRIFFSVQGGESVTDLAQGSSFTEKQMSSYAEVARSPLVLAPVLESLALSRDTRELSASLRVSVAADTTILVIAATDKDPALARDIANAVADELAATVGGLSPDRPDGSESVRATMLSEAPLPSEPSSPNTTRNLLFGLAVGVLLGVGVALLREALDTKVRSETDLAAVANSAIIGAITFDEAAPSHPIVMHDDPHGQRSESYRRLRTNLQFLDLAERPSSVVVTSSISGEGKSTTATNLAVTLADAGSSVVLVDADLRRPSVADYTGLEGRVGLTTVLIGKATLDDVIQPWGDSTLDVLTSGQVPPNPSELLGSRAMTALLRQLTDRYDIVILDSPPLLPVTDAAVLSNQVGGMLVVVGADRIHKAQLRDSLESLETVGAHILGLVLNKVSRQDSDRYGYSYDSYRSMESVGEGRRTAHTSTRARRRR